MGKFIPPGFDAARVTEGLHKAMGFGEPTRTEDKATFFFPKRSAAGQPRDGAGVPFDPDQHPTASSKAKVQVPCVVEYHDAAELLAEFGGITPSRVKITVLDPEWQQIKDFAYVVAGGDKYVRTKVEPPIALGSIDVWTIWCTAEDER